MAKLCKILLEQIGFLVMTESSKRNIKEAESKQERTKQSLNSHNISGLRNLKAHIDKEAWDYE